MKVLKIMGIVIGIIAALAAAGIIYLYKKASPYKIAEYIRDNPEKTSIYFEQNDSVLVQKNPDKVMPLASTVKIIIAIEFARQAAEGRINPDELVDTSEPAKYYLKNTDGGAHPGWLKYVAEQKLITGGKVRLEDIAKGMIVFSSNANTEYLMEKLGLDSINANIEKLGLNNQQKLYPIVSALLVCNGLTKEKLQQMPLERYIDSTYVIHKRLAAGEYAIKNALGNIPLDVQRVWSDRLPGGTTREYAAIMKKINSGTYFDTVVEMRLRNLMEGLMTNPKNQEWLAHAGMKGGSTAFVLTMALYATTKKGETTELAYFFNDLALTDNLLMQAAMNQFHLDMLTSKEKRNKLLTIINDAKK